MRTKLTRDGAIETLLAADIYWTLDGAEALLDYLDELAAARGTATDYDAAVRPGQWAEYDSVDEAARAHGWRHDTDDTLEEQERAARLWLDRRYNTIIPFSDGVIVGKGELARALVRLESSRD